MKEWLIFATDYAVTVIDWLALIIIVVGTAETFFAGMWTMFSSPDGHEKRDVWLRLGRWLVAGLTFQLAADILETAVTTSWDEVGRLGAIAVCGQQCGAQGVCLLHGPVCHGRDGRHEVFLIQEQAVAVAERFGKPRVWRH